MGRSRTELQTLLEDLLGSRNVYFQPPESIKMNYPCIVYSRNDGRTQFANNRPYRFTKRYSLTYISRNPEDDMVDKIAELPMCIYDRHYTADNLHHDTFQIYF